MRALVDSTLLSAIALTVGVACSEDEARSAPPSVGTGAAGGAGGTGGMGGMGGVAQGGGAGDGGAGPPPNVEVKFEARVGAEPFDCASTYANLGTTGANVGLSDFRFYVHDVRLVEAGSTDEVPIALTQDGLWQYTADPSVPEDGVVLLDFENDTGTCVNGTTPTNTVVTGNVPDGNYDGIKFRVGVPASLNHAEVATAPSPLNFSAMFWSWSDGYKYVRIDAQGLLPADDFDIHLGGTLCMGDPFQGDEVTCGNPNRPEVSFESFSATDDVIVLDYAALVAGTDLTQNGCYSEIDDPDCTELFAALGIDLVTGAMTGMQTVFTVK